MWLKSLPWLSLCSHQCPILPTWAPVLSPRGGIQCSGKAGLSPQPTACIPGPDLEVGVGTPLKGTQDRCLGTSRGPGGPSPALPSPLQRQVGPRWTGSGTVAASWQAPQAEGQRHGLGQEHSSLLERPTWVLWRLTSLQPRCQPTLHPHTHATMPLVGQQQPRGRRDRPSGSRAGRSPCAACRAGLA